jgi:hypothetical protein
MDYEKNYEINDFSKRISGTLIVPYPYNEFVLAESMIRNNCGTITLECAESNKNNELISAELTGSALLLSHSNYPLSLSYNYVILIE